MRVTEESEARLVIKEYPQEGILNLVAAIAGALFFLLASDGLWANIRDPDNRFTDYWITALAVIFLASAVVYFAWNSHAIRLELDAGQNWAFLHREGFFRNRSKEWPLETFRGARVQTRIKQRKGMKTIQRRAILLFEENATFIEAPVTHLLTSHKGTIPAVNRINAWQAARGGPVLKNRGDGPPASPG